MARNNSPKYFVPNPPEAAVSDAAVFHHGANSEQEQLLSGSLKVEFTTLTPTFVGMHQVKLNEIDGAVKQTIPSWNLPDEKTAATPWLATWLPKKPVPQGQGHAQSDVAPVLWHGAAVKGMVRSHLGMLLSAPMERVNDARRSFRPNMDGAANGKILRRKIAIVESITRDGDQIAKLALRHADFSSSHMAFVRDEAVLKQLQRSHPAAAAPGSLGTVNPGQFGAWEVDYYDDRKLHKYRRMLIKVGSTTTDLRGRGAAAPTPLDDWTCHRYAHGVDGVAAYAKAFAEQMQRSAPALHPAILIAPGVLSSPLTLKWDVHPALVQYELTRKHMLGNDHGQHRHAHPLDGQASYPKTIDAWRRIEPGDALVMELDDASGEVVTIGHHFMYRTRMADTICNEVHWDASSSNFNWRERPQVSPLQSEHAAFVNRSDGGSSLPTGELSGARGLMGFVQGSAPVAQPEDANHLGRLKGRLEFNHWLEQCDVPGEHGLRFIWPGDNCWVPLAEQGSPGHTEEDVLEPDPSLSAIQPVASLGHDLRLSGGRLTVSNRAKGLAGRAIYLHQPRFRKRDDAPPRTPEGAQDVERDSESQPFRGGLKSTRAALLRYVSAPGVTFRGTLTFTGLRKWELGALWAILDADAFVQHLLRLRSDKPSSLGDAVKRVLAKYKPEQADQEHVPLAALKIGRGQALGLGSIRTSSKPQGPLGVSQEACFSALLQKMKYYRDEEPDRVLASWLRAVLFDPNDNTVRHYPSPKERNEVRRRMAQARRGTLPPADLNALQHARLTPLHELP